MGSQSGLLAQDGREPRDMEGGGHGRPVRQDPEAAGPPARRPQLPQDPRVQGVHHRPAHRRRLQGDPREGHRHHLPQGWLHHLAQPQAGAQRVRQRRAHLRPPPQQDRRVRRAGSVTRDLVKADEVEFQKVIDGRVKENGGKLKYVTINKEEKEVEVKDLKTLSEVIEGLKADFPGLQHMRVPICNSASPLESTLTSSATPLSEPASTPPSLSTTRWASPGPPPAPSSPASSRSSRSTPPLRVSLRPSLVSTWTC